ncbi:hypothetical protein TNCV_4882221 [Trichonephila clavipes]|nr:hypothetical protein TNCV_4882221 [Trichonephila clavipes]
MPTCTLKYCEVLSLVIAPATFDTVRTLTPPTSRMYLEDKETDRYHPETLERAERIRPLGVRISPLHGTCREGSVLELVCRSWGSRPPAEITWWMKNFRLHNVTGYRFEVDTSSSSLSLYPLASDNGKVIVCKAENPKLPGILLTDSITLNVTFPPKVTLSLKTYSSSSLSEGDTVALICNVVSNPAVGPVLWTFVQETSVAPPYKKFPQEGPQTLVLERLQPWHKGSYRCRATNSEGFGESNALWLAVRHRPICKAGQQVSYGAYFGETLNIRCEVEAEPAAVSFHWGFSNTVVQHSNVSFVSRGLKSMATYTPTDDIHLGSLFCWANNSAGEQHVPCTFTVFKPGVYVLKLLSACKSEMHFSPAFKVLTGGTAPPISSSINYVIVRQIYSSFNKI